MSSITTQQTKLDLELVPKENRIDIGKCNGRIPRGDIFQIFPRVQDREFDPLPSEEDTVSFLRELGHTGVINSLNDVVVDQMHHPGELLLLLSTGVYLERLVVLTSFVSPEHKSFGIYGAIHPECLTSLAMKESKVYKTYLGYATGVVPPKMARKFKKASPSKKDSNLPAAGVVIKEAPMETKSKSKEKEKVDVTRGKGIELLYEVALIEEAQMKEVRKKSLRDFHKTHPSGSGMVAEKPLSVNKITPSVTRNDEDNSNNDQDSSNEDSEQENKSKEQVSDLEQEEESEDDDQEEE
ncbi:hypothetical protein Tco_0046946 [Tanacetum coccineum]